MKITVNSREYDVKLSRNGAEVGGRPLTADIKRIDAATFHVLSGTRSFMAEVISFDKAGKKCVLKINAAIYYLDISDRYSELLFRLGLDLAVGHKITELKAPMPGMVLQVFVKEGDAVKKDQSLLTLEAMKMENILKAPADAVVRSVKAVLGSKVEKNQLLISFE